MSADDNFSLQSRKKIVTMRDLFGIRYYLKYYRINSTPAIEHFMNQTYEKGYDPTLYNRTDNYIIRNLIDLILYSNPEPVEDLIRMEKQKLLNLKFNKNNDLKFEKKYQLDNNYKVNKKMKN